MARHKESEYRYAVRRYRSRGKGTVENSRHMTKKNAERALTRVRNDGRRGYIIKL